MADRLRQLTDPFVVAAPSGVRVRTRLRLSADDEQVLGLVGAHLGALAGRDLAERCRMAGKASKHEGRTVRKKALTGQCSSRWAGSITRVTADQWERGLSNLYEEAQFLHRAIRAIERRLAVPVGGRHGKSNGYITRQQRWQKHRRRQILQSRLSKVQAQIEARQPSIVRGGARMARNRHNLADAGISEAEWAERWKASRLFLTADGEAGKAWGNETIRVHPDEGWLEIRLPTPLAHLSNTPGWGSQYRLSCPVKFNHRADGWETQVRTGAVRYDITYNPDRDRWYLDASWTFTPRTSPTLETLTSHKVLAVDLNDGLLAAWIVSPDGNPTGRQHTITTTMDGPSSERDGHLRAAITELVSIAKTHGCRAVVIENLNFDEARATGRETMGRGRRGRRFRRTVAGLPTGRFRDRLVCMAANAGLWVIAVDPAYSSIWGGQHWQQPLGDSHNTKTSETSVSRHHAAAVVLGRRSLGHRARRRTGDPNRDQRITEGKVPSRPDTGPGAATGEETGEGSPPWRPPRKTVQPDPDPPTLEGSEDRSRSPTEQDLLLHGV